jgi:hypothetical protein
MIIGLAKQQISFTKNSHQNLPGNKYEVVETNNECCRITRIFVRTDGILIIEDFLPLDEVKSLKSACDRLVQVSLLTYVSSLNKSSLDASNLTSNPAEKRSIHSPAASQL